MSTTIRFMMDQRDGTTVELGSIKSENGKTFYSATKSLIDSPDRRDIITLALLQWVQRMNEWAENQDQKETNHGKA